MNPPKDIEKYGVHYDETSLFNKIKTAARKAGIKVVWCALVLYYAVTASGLTSRERALILGALGYFILPMDLIPDFMPFLGYADDYAALAYVFYKVAKSITPEVKQRANEKLRDWFRDYDKKEIIIDKVD